ncbi:AAA family ATPase [Shewanella sp. 4_MG-2023]|uniref:AAA family ATPase n=1 Tax=Shewanella sp. 4_MG-2023 TaxID=3062652 RepID=UPI0026E3A3F2|nr:AAA family ATPase [Shewanella sp. 4_MG-2023]MDO6680160.1 AAA family ATPase [Shewanella sp. 4_MG-2023]
MKVITIQEIELHRFKRYRNKTIGTPDGFCLLAGSNNSGKSTFMQAFALWEFCKNLIKLEHGDGGLLNDHLGKKQGVGVNGEDFLPLNIPSLKHLWTNLKVNPEEDSQGNKEPDGYTLWLEVKWINSSQEEPRYLRFSLSLANERLFVKTTRSNISNNEELPQVAYIPPFAGILNREPFHTKAMRSRLVGQGLSGSVMRNTLLELFKRNQTKRKELLGDKSRISPANLRNLRETDRWEHLLEVMRRLFDIELFVHDFNEDYHSYIKIEYWKGAYNEAGTKFIKYTGFNRRDIMVEGSGFLQLLNVLSLALDPSYQVIFLDEPDAHLHPSLQFSLLDELNTLAEKYHKQILFATHSTELIASQPPENIMKFENGKVKILNDESQKVGLITGLGSEFSPQLHKLQRTKKVLFVENDSDADTIKILAEKIGTPISPDIVVWAWPGKHVERQHLFNQLKRVISGLTGISLRDRDGQPFETITESLLDKNNVGCDKDGLLARTWRFRYIESYLLSPKAIARAAVKTEDDVIESAKVFGVDLGAFDPEKIINAYQELPSKPILTEGENCLTVKYGISKYDIANAMEVDEIHVDIKALISQIVQL